MALVSDTIMEIGSFLDLKSIKNFKLINKEWYEVYTKRYIEIYINIIVRSQNVELFVKAIRYRPDIVKFVLKSPLFDYKLLRKQTLHECKCYSDRSSKEYSGTALHAACRYNFESFKLILNSKWCTSELLEICSAYYTYTDEYCGVVFSGTVLHLACDKNIPAALYLIRSKFNIKKLLMSEQVRKYESIDDSSTNYITCLAQLSNDSKLTQAIQELI